MLSENGVCGLFFSPPSPPSLSSPLVTWYFLGYRCSVTRRGRSLSTFCCLHNRFWAPFATTSSPIYSLFPILLLLNLPALSHQGNHFISWKLGEEDGWWCGGGGQPRLLILNNYIVRVFVQADVQEPTPLSVISSCYLKINQRKAEEFNYTGRREKKNI